MKLKNITKIALLSLSALSFAALVSCKEKGPAEKAGEKVDETMEKAGDKIEEAGDKMKDATN